MSSKVLLEKWEASKLGELSASSLEEKFAKLGFKYNKFFTHPNYQTGDRSYGTDRAIAVLKGALEVNVQESNFALGPGDVLFLPSNTVHSAKSASDTEKCVFYELLK